MNTIHEEIGLEGEKSYLKKKGIHGRNLCLFRCATNASDPNLFFLTFSFVVFILVKPMKRSPNAFVVCTKEIPFGS